MLQELRPAVMSVTMPYYTAQLIAPTTATELQQLLSALLRGF